MILLTETEILSAVRRSLAAHVLDELPESSFARVQVEAALVALDEVVSRLEHGDPYTAVNDRLEARLAGLSGPADAVLAAAAAAATEPGPRARNTALGEAIWAAVDDAPDETARAILGVVAQNATLTAGEDAAWSCPAAIRSLQ